MACAHTEVMARFAPGQMDVLGLALNVTSIQGRVPFRDDRS